MEKHRERKESSVSAGIAVNPLKKSVTIKKMIHCLIVFVFFSILESALYFKVYVQKNLLYSFNHIFQCRDMICKRFFADFCHRIGGICFSSDKSFVHFYVSVFFKADKVGRQVTIRNLEHLFEIIKADLVIYHQDAHHAKTDSVIKYFIETCYRIFQFLFFKPLNFYVLSYFHHITIP